MTFFTTLARFLTRRRRVALPALLVDYDFCAECFVGDIDRVCAMAFRALVSALPSLFSVVMAKRTIDPGGLEIVRMRRGQFLGIYLMVTLGTLDREILYVHLMVKGDFPD
jgi:hypothetical protein